jgi:adenosylcobinamide-GDP ribazoletransferase
VANRENNLNIASQWTADVMLALAFLTRLPVPLNEASGKRPLSDVAWAFPIVGLLVGGLAGLALLLGFQIGQHPFVCGLFAIGVSVLVTGALHEDGLADVADGFGGAHKVSDKLRIMRDSRIGSYGVLAMIFSIALRAGALAGMLTPTMAVLSLIAAGAVSRGLVVAVMNQIDMARSDGLGAGAGKPSGEGALVALGLGATAAFLLLGADGWMVLIMALIAAVFMAWLARRQIGGLTGDVLGAVQQVTETAVLLTAVAVL